LESTCKELLDCCLSGGDWSLALLDRALAVNEGRAFLSIVVERLGDLFEPELCRVYDRLFRQVIERVTPELTPRIRVARQTPPLPASASRVYVLSRITLGADVAVTSVFLDAAKHLYPEAQIIFVGPRKNYELFEADPRIQHMPAPYARSGALQDRLRASASLWFEDGIVLDPDSRLSQLGVLSICPEENYCFFESRSYGGSSLGRLPDLAAQWFGQDARNYVSPKPPALQAGITVSLGVGDNENKRVGDAFESDLLQLLDQTGETILVDKGASEAERQRVEAALTPRMQTHDGPFAPFAAAIAKSKLFVGYDSAAGHVASACGIPLISIASGFVCERAAARWRPSGTVLTGPPEKLLAGVKESLRPYFTG
jgi:hypothetical protein